MAQLTEDQARAAQELAAELNRGAQVADKTPQPNAHSKEQDANFAAVLKRLSPEDKEFLARHANAVWTEESGNAKRSTDAEYRHKLANINRGEFEAEKNKLK